MEVRCSYMHQLPCRVGTWLFGRSSIRNKSQFPTTIEGNELDRTLCSALLGNCDNVAQSADTHSRLPTRRDYHSVLLTSKKSFV